MATYYCKTRLADKNIEIESINKHVLQKYKDYLSGFEEADYVINATAEEIRQKVISFAGIPFPDDPEIATEFRDSEFLVHLQKAAGFLIRFGILLIHGAAISVEGKGYIFIAPSGTGKTTHIMNWLKRIPGTIVVNGDKPFVDAEKKTIYGSPWCGKEGMNTNISVPLSGLIFLERGEENSIAPQMFKKMLPIIIQQTHIPTDANLTVYKLIDKIRNVPCYTLKCNMEPESALVAYNGIKENECHV